MGAQGRAGDPTYRDYFLVFPDRAVPDAYERTLPEVFPDFAPGSFTWDDELDGWVWTTFNDYQWDVNWANPDVLCEYADIDPDPGQRRAWRCSGSTRSRSPGSGWAPTARTSRRCTP